MPGAIFINGRFLTQRVTGVQRYGREVLKALDALLTAGVVDARGRRITVLTPRPPLDPPPLARIELHTAGRLTGLHAGSTYSGSGGSP